MSAAQAELDLVRAFLWTPGLLSDTEGLTPEHFGEPLARAVYRAMESLHSAEAQLDPRTLRVELERTGVLEALGGWAVVGLSLVDSHKRLESIEPLVSAIKDAALKRRAVAAVETFHRDILAPGSPADAITRTVAELSRLAEGGPDATACEGAGLLRACTGAVETLLSGDGSGLSTGFRGLDGLNVTLNRGEVMVIAAGTSRGKSALGAQIAYGAAKDGARSMFASLEMSQTQTLRRFVSHEARVPLDLMRRNADNPAAVERLTRAASRIAESGLIVADLSRDTRLSRLVASAQAAKSRGGLDVVVLDYLGLLTLDGSRRGASRYEVTTELSREVKLASLRLGVAVVLLVQLSREPERREGGKPQLSDLRDSGAIEQDADVVILIHRAATSSEGALLVSKNRNGPCGEVPVTFDGATFTFRERLADHRAA